VRSPPPITLAGCWLIWSGFATDHICVRCTRKTRLFSRVNDVCHSVNPSWKFVYDFPHYSYNIGIFLANARTIFTLVTLTPDLRMVRTFHFIRFHGAVPWEILLHGLCRSTHTRQTKCITQSNAWKERGIMHAGPMIKTKWITRPAVWRPWFFAFWPLNGHPGDMTRAIFLSVLDFSASCAFSFFS